jgi:hypothetical protein
MIYVHANKRKARINGIICAATTIPRIEKFQPAAANVHNAERKLEVNLDHQGKHEL